MAMTGCRWRRSAGRPGSARRRTSTESASTMGCCRRRSGGSSSTRTRTASCAAWWRISVSTRRGCRTSSAENSEACPEAQAGRRSAWRVGCIDPAGVPGIASRYLDPPLRVSSSRAGHLGEPDQGDLPDVGALWPSPRARIAAS